ncbi:hypothetical protein KKB55_12170, partial [Myxococcota bacterium]|nr:hypothetical protein [Myxococcota bacterium]
MGPVNDWGPAARLTSLDLPADTNAAMAAGCTVQGEKYGSSLGGLLALTAMIPGAPQPTPGEPILAPYLNEDENGEIQLIMLAQLNGWAEGQTGNDVGTADLRFFLGDYVDSKFFIDPSAFIDGDPANEPLVHFAAEVSNGQLSTEPAPYFFNMPIMEGLELAITLAQTEVFGALTVEGGGWGANGVIQGYITREGLITLIEALQVACNSEAPPSFCAQAGQFIDINDTDAVMGFLLSLVSLDAFVGADNMPAACTGEGGDRECCPAEGCNAISVCLPAIMSPITISGLSAAGK